VVEVTVLAGQRPDPSHVPVAAFVDATAEVALALDATGRIQHVSAAFVALFGQGAAAVTRRRFTAVVHRDDAMKVDEAVRRAADGDPQLLSHRMRDVAGDCRWVESRVQRLSSDRDAALLVVSRDTQEQVAHRTALLGEVAAFDDIFNELREGVVVIDDRGSVVAVNDAAAGFLGVMREDVRGSLARAFVTVLDEQGHPMPAERLPSTRAFRTGLAQHEAVQYRRQDGSSVWLFARTVPLFDAGERSPTRVAIFLENAAPREEAPPALTSAVATAAHSVLTTREDEVLRLLAQGHDVRTISRRLDITVNTARGHVRQIMRKLGARTQLQAVVVALRAGLVQLD
jgi:PAS domain S-box-containing protein